MQTCTRYSLPRLGGMTATLLGLLAGCIADADVSVTHLFGDHMMLQRDMAVAVWGSADAGEAVTVSIAGNTARTVAGPDGKWSVELPMLPAGGPHELKIEGNNTLTFTDVLVGEVWIASGQSNMEWKLGNGVIDNDLAALRAARRSDIRVLAVKGPGSQEPQTTVTGTWTVAAPETVGGFTAVGYHFAEMISDALGVPVGIIDNSWGGSAAEAWVPRSALASHPVLQEVNATWLEREATYDFAAELAAYEADMAKWKTAAAAAQAAGTEEPNQPRKPNDMLTHNQRPANLWNARVLPVVPFPVRGVIWYQGEANAGRAHQYHELFSLLISEWRKAWGREFPFYWVQLADFMVEAEFGQNENWPLLREAQTDTLHSVPGTGQAVIIGLGEGKDIHPRQKEEVARRLARWALNRDYGFADLACRAPEFAGYSQDGARLVVSFSYTGGGLRAFDTQELRGFVVLQDGRWQTVAGKVTAPDTVELALPSDAPIDALRYAWANNPVCNLYTVEGLPATPFRTDRH